MKSGCKRPRTDGLKPDNIKAIKHNELCDSKTVVFNHPHIALQNRIILAALYPPKRSYANLQHNNRTSRDIANRLGHLNFDWIDIYPESPLNKSGDMKLSKLENFLVQNPNYRHEWIKKINMRSLEIQNKNFKPIIFVCGNNCKQEWKKFNYNETKLHPTIELYELKDEVKEVFVFYGKHPSAHLMACGNNKRVQEFYKNMHILNYILNNGNLNDLDQFVSIQEKLHRENEMKCCYHLFGSSQWPKDYSYMTNMPFENSIFCDRIMTLKDNQCLENPSFTIRIIDDCFWTKTKLYTQFLNTSVFCVNIVNPLFEERIAQIKEMMGNSDMFKYEGFCSRITETDFYELFQKCLSTNASLTKRLFSGYGFCKRITDAEFQNRYTIFKKEFYANNVAQLFSNDAFCTHLLTNGFSNILQTIKEIVRSEKYFIKLFSTSSFVVNIIRTPFLSIFCNFYAASAFTHDDVINLFSTDGFSANIESFKEKFDFLVMKYDKTGILKLFKTDSFCRRIKNITFLNTFVSFIDIYGYQNTVQLFSTESFCVYMDNPEFSLIFEELVREYNEKGLLLFTTGAFCKNIVNQSFNQIFKKIIVNYSAPVAFELFGLHAFCNNIGKRDFYNLYESIIQNYQLCDVLRLFSSSRFCLHLDETLYNILRKMMIEHEYSVNQIIQIFSTTNFCIYIGKDKFKRVFNEMIDKYKFKNIFRLFLTNGFCKKLEDDDFRSFFHEMVESKIFLFKDIIRIFSNDGFCNNFLQFKATYYKVLTTCNLPQQYFIRLFSTSGFCSNIEKEEFHHKFFEMVGNRNYSADDIVRLFSNDIFCNHVIKISIYFEKLLFKFPKEIVINLFSSKQFCKHIEHEEFKKKFEIMIDENLLSCEEMMTLFSKDGFCGQFANQAKHNLFVKIFKQSIIENGKDITLKLFQNIEVCNNITQENFYSELKLFMTKYPHLLHRFGVVFASKFQDPKFMSIVENDYKMYPLHFDLLYLNGNYIKNCDSITFHENITRVIVKYFHEDDRIGLYKSEAFVRKMGGEKKEDLKYDDVIEKWQRKCHPFKINHIFQCNSFITHCEKEEFEFRFDELTGKMDKYFILSHTPGLKIAMDLASVSTFSSKDDWLDILNRFDYLVEKYTFKIAFVLFQSATFVGRIENEIYFYKLENSFEKYGIEKTVFDFIDDKFNMAIFKFNQNLRRYIEVK